MLVQTVPTHYSPTTPTIDLSRHRLCHLASWIRDDLGLVVAQDGPEKLHPDDVLTLHEIFLALSSSPTITHLDLRATGIHRAVVEVAGIATRWPGRLADDCDRIINVWTTKFGRLDDLRPFMYGRGGRLEGVASPDEFSRTVSTSAPIVTNAGLSTKVKAVLKRWQETCPEKIASRRSRRYGGLGFKAGAWWLTPLFAHHAGIIDLSTVKGGICHDKHGAYALLLKDNDEIEAPIEASFTYRCHPTDKGRYRLTAATPKSRCPIRILRSHNLNSVWGPKAGVRYEGLYRVVGWIIRPVKHTEAFGLGYRAGDLFYEIKFERDDDMPMEEVMKHPNAAELDDYAEYKRLRRVHREALPNTNTKVDGQPMLKGAPPISPVGPTVARPKTALKTSPSASRMSTSKGTVSISTSPSLRISPPPLKATSSMLFEESVDPILAQRKQLLEFRPVTATNGNRFKNYQTKHESPNRVIRTLLQPLPSPSASWRSERSHASGRNSGNLHNIREVAPWIDLEPQLEVPTPSPRIKFTRQSVIPAPSVSSSGSGSEQCPVQSRKRSAHGDRQSASSAKDEARKQRRQEGRASRASIMQLRKNTSHRDVKPHNDSRNPLAKLFDGADEVASSSDDETFFSEERAGQSFNSISNPRMNTHHTKASSSEAVVRPLSPAPFRPLSPPSTLITQRRDARCFPCGFSPLPSSDPFEDAVASSRWSVSSDDPFISPTLEPGLLRPFASKDVVSDHLLARLANTLSEASTFSGQASLDGNWQKDSSTHEPAAANIPQNANKITARAALKDHDIAF